jgi:hypothetical protein
MTWKLWAVRVAVIAACVLMLRCFYFFNPKD